MSPLADAMLREPRRLSGQRHSFIARRHRDQPEMDRRIAPHERVTIAAAVRDLYWRPVGLHLRVRASMPVFVGVPVRIRLTQGCARERNRHREEEHYGGQAKHTRP